jgi:hypothetical protein
LGFRKKNVPLVTVQPTVASLKLVTWTCDGLGCHPAIDKNCAISQHHSWSLSEHQVHCWTLNLIYIRMESQHGEHCMCDGKCSQT